MEPKRMNASTDKYNQDKINSLNKELECQICLEGIDLDDPRQCPKCGQTWCMIGIKKELEARKGCPNCKKNITFNDLCKNRILSNYFKSLETINKSKISCQTHKDNHEDCNLYCKIGKKFICSECVASNTHNNNNLLTLKALREECRKTIKIKENYYRIAIKNFSLKIDHCVEHYDCSLAQKKYFFDILDQYFIDSSDLCADSTFNNVEIEKIDALKSIEEKLKQGRGKLMELNGQIDTDIQKVLEYLNDQNNFNNFGINDIYYLLQFEHLIKLHDNNVKLDSVTLDKMKALGEFKFTTTEGDIFLYSHHPNAKNKSSYGFYIHSPALNAKNFDHIHVRIYIVSAESYTVLFETFYSGKKSSRLDQEYGITLDSKQDTIDMIDTFKTYNRVILCFQFYHHYQNKNFKNEIKTELLERITNTIRLRSQLNLRADENRKDENRNYEPQIQYIVRQPRRSILKKIFSGLGQAWVIYKLIVYFFVYFTYPRFE